MEALPTTTEVGDVRVKLLVPSPLMMSEEKTVPEFPAAAPGFRLTVTGETGQGGVGPLSAAAIVAPGATLEPNPTVQTAVAAWAGAIARAQHKPLITVSPPNFSANDMKL